MSDCVGCKKGNGDQWTHLEETVVSGAVGVAVSGSAVEAGLVFGGASQGTNVSLHEN
jgi:hypothetical protein